MRISQLPIPTLPTERGPVFLHELVEGSELILPAIKPPKRVCCFWGGGGGGGREFEYVQSLDYICMHGGCLG